MRHDRRSTVNLDLDAGEKGGVDDKRSAEEDSPSNRIAFPIPGVNDFESRPDSGDRRDVGGFRKPSKRFMQLLTHVDGENDAAELGEDTSLTLEQIMQQSDGMADEELYDKLLRRGGINPERFKSFIRAQSDMQVFELLDTKKVLDQRLTPEEQEQMQRNHVERMREVEEAEQRRARRRLLKRVVMSSGVLDKMPRNVRQELTGVDETTETASFVTLQLTQDQYMVFVGQRRERTEEFDTHIRSIASGLLQRVSIDHSSHCVDLYWDMDTVGKKLDLEREQRAREKRRREEREERESRKRAREKSAGLSKGVLDASGMSKKEIESMAQMEDMIRDQLKGDPNLALETLMQLGIPGNDLREYLEYIMTGGVRSRTLVWGEAEDDGAAGVTAHLTPEEQSLLDSEREKNRQLQQLIPEDDPLVLNGRIYEGYVDDFDRFRQMRNMAERQRYLKEIWSKVNIPSLKLPRKLVKRVEELIREYPRNSLRKTARLLSATFRIRTGGHGNLYMFTEEDEKAAKEKELLERKLHDDGQVRVSEENQDIYKQQLELLQQLHGYKRKAHRLNSKQAKQADTRSGGGSKSGALAQQPQIIYGELEAVAYIAHRLPAVYGTSFRIFHEIKRRMPDFRPRSLLDFGTGPGTSIWAARDVWLTEQWNDDGSKVMDIPEQNGLLEEIMAVEPSSAMMDIAMRLAQEDEDNPDHIQRQRSHLTWRRFHNENSRRKYDVVMASYVLNEIADERERERVIKSLWNSTQGVLVFVEPGTPLGFKLIEQARRIVLAQRDKSDPMRNPTVLAPCPHDAECPMSKKKYSWCHFSQRLEREVFQKTVKEGITMNYEDEKFSFVVLKRFDMTGRCSEEEIEEKVYDYGEKLALENEEGRVDAVDIDRRLEWEQSIRHHADESKRWPRIVRRPLKRSGHTLLDLCMPEGTILDKVTITRSDQKFQGGYKYSRRAFWGDLFPLDWLNNTRLLKARKERLRQKQLEESEQQDPALMMRAQMFGTNEDGKKGAPKKKKGAREDLPELDEEQLLERALNREREKILQETGDFTPSAEYLALENSLEQVKEKRDFEEQDQAVEKVEALLERVRARREKRERNVK